jgi:hypothetical protein
VEEEGLHWRGIILSAIAEAVTTGGLLHLGSRDPDWSMRFSGAVACAVSFGGLCSIVSIAVAAENRTAGTWPGWVFLGIFAGCLLTAAVMDWWEKMVYRFVWWVGGGAAGLFLLTQIGQHLSLNEMGSVLWGRESPLWGLGIFLILQQQIFGRFYGRADCHAFCVCAVLMTAFGLRLADYLMHMMLTFGALTVVQLCRRNVTSRGKLREPKALVPYIAVCFWLWVDFAAGKWYI